MSDGRLTAAGFAIVVAWTLSCSDRAFAPSCEVKADTSTWQFLGLQDNWITSIAKTTGGVFVGTNGNGLWQASCVVPDATWVQRGLPGLRVKGLVPILSAKSEELFAAAAHRDPLDRMSAVVFWSKDGGRTWLERDAGHARRVFGAADGMSIIADDRTPGKLIAGLGNSIIVSADYGASWIVTLGVVVAAGPDVEALAISHAPGGTRIWAAGQHVDTNGFAYYSDDGGLTWHETPVRPGGTLGDNNFVAALLADPAERDHVFAGLPNALWVTRDAGATWSIPLRTVYLGAVHALVRMPRALLAVSSEFEIKQGKPVRGLLGVYVSRDDGQSWSSMPVPVTAVGGYSAIRESDTTALIGTAKGLWRVRIY